jgi:lipid A disaccharide synthetase
MTKGSREKDIKLLVTKFMKLVESLNPGERLSIRKVAAKKKTTKKKAAKKSARTAGQRPTST